MTDRQKTETTKEDLYTVQLRTGAWVFFLLLVFTAGEYIAAVISPTLGWLLIIAALPKAFYVLTEYMHIRHLVESEEEDHE